MGKLLLLTHFVCYSFFFFFFLFSQELVYNSWEKLREDEVQFQIKEYKKKQLLNEIEKKKKDLEEREEVIYFFDNQEKLEMLLPDRKKRQVF